MTAQPEVTALKDLEFISYLDDSGKLPELLEKKIGIYAIFNQDQVLQYVGYSRDIFLSLKQHLVRQPDQCYGLKVLTIDRPSRSILESVQAAWIAENGSIPPGNSEQLDSWTQPINVKPMMTAAEEASYNQEDEVGQEKVLKNVARRVEAEILSVLKQRGMTEDIRFNPKLKTGGLLDLK
ncbi:MAG: GIY-YIG nuclease family protein [Microcoleaceae cyanobacterium]